MNSSHPTRHSWLIKISLVILFLSAFSALLLWLFTGMLATMASEVPPPARPAIRSEFLPFPSEQHHIPSLDGTRIAFRYFPTSSDPRLPVLFIVHGFGASKEHMLTYMLFAQKNGYPSVGIDLRGHGDSDPALCSFGYREKQDVLAVAQWLNQKGHPRYVLWGTSMGAVTSALTAETQPQGLQGLILDAPFDTLRNTLVHHAKVFFNLPEFPFFPLTFWQIERTVGYDTRQINVPRALQSIHQPLLILAAENDERMPLPMVRGLYDLAHSPKTLHIIPGADHEYRAFDPEFQEAVLTFLRRLPDLDPSPATHNNP
ncbi:MAG: alpha/beta hydrolase [Blastochloris sp.]|nr:alpha/beta hydrolase [Blastochloris sp.]